jgi:hypothetical protein
MASRTTPFRANEKAASGRDDAIYHFSRGFKEPGERKAAAAYVDRLIEEFGPVVDGYPSWHPFTQPTKKEDRRGANAHTSPQGFEGLDHTIYFRDAFVTAPYSKADRVVASANEKRNYHIVAEEIVGIPLYFYNTYPVLVKCIDIPKEPDGTIEKRFALGSMLASELPAWTWAECCESWEDMRRYILGPPCGSRSSLFVNQETGKALREVFELLTRHGLFGPPRSVIDEPQRQEHTK